MLQKLPSTFAVTVALLSMALVLGGGQGGMGDTFSQILALALLALLYARKPDLKSWPLASVWAVLPLLALAVFLLPWPEMFTASGAARTQLIQDLAPASVALISSGGLIASSTERALYWLLPAAALYLSVLQLSHRKRELLVRVLIFWLLLNATLGLMQRAAGPESSLYFYSNTNPGAAVGLFANANHYAISLATGLALIFATVVSLFSTRGVSRIHPLWLVLLLLCAIVFMLGFLLSGSLAAIMLGVFGCFMMVPAIISANKRDDKSHWVFTLIILGLIAIVPVSLYFVALEFQNGSFDDLRLQFIQVSSLASQDFSPWGSGPGAFWFVFPQYDTEMITGNVIVNHAHNDYLELWLEMRWIFALVALAMISVYMAQGLHLWFRAKAYSRASVLLARAAWIALLLLLLHSLVDYPLRTSAILAMAGVLAALLTIPESQRISEENA